MTLGQPEIALRKARALAAAGFALALLLWAPRPIAADAFLTGKLLVAGPDLVDPNFSRTVVFMVSHDPGGAMGLVINRPLGSMPLGDLLQALESPGDGAQPDPPRQEPAQPEDDRSSGDGPSVPVYFGGPVEPFVGFTLHSRDVMLENSVPVDDVTALNAHDEALRALAEGTGPQKMIFLLGYAGWGPGQLEYELAGGDWYVVEADPDLIFSEEPAGIWEQALSRFTTEL